MVDATQREIDEALAGGVKLVTAPKDAVITHENRLLLFDRSRLPGFLPEAVFGHDHITGSAAYHIAERVYDRVPYVHFVHTLPEEIEPYKSRSGSSYLRAASKADAQIKQCELAKLVVAIGPRIYRDIDTRLAANSVCQFQNLDQA